MKPAWKFLEDHLGETETSANRGPWIDKCLRFVGLEPDHAPLGGYPWCCAAFITCCAEAGIILPRTGKVERLWSLVQHRRIGEIEPGCAGVHLNEDGTGHIVFVLGENPDGTLRTLSGNTNAAGSRTGGQVAYVDHGYDYFVDRGGFFHLRDDSEDDTQPGFVR